MPEPKATGTFMGVCATIANKYDLDVFIVRIVATILLFITGFTFVIVYCILGIFASEAK